MISENEDTGLLEFTENRLPYQIVKKHIHPVHLNQSYFISDSILGVHKLYPYHPQLHRSVRVWFTLHDDAESNLRRIIAHEKKLQRLDNPYIIPLRTPRLLLGRHKTLKFQFPFLFETFFDLINAFRKHEVPPLANTFFAFRVLMAQEGPHIHEMDASIIKSAIMNYDAGYHESSQNKSILLALVFRLTLLQSICETPSFDKTTLYHTQLYIDTHLDLLRYIVFHSKYSDEELLDRFENPEDSIASPLDCFYPRDDRFFAAGDLFDISPCLDMGNAWNDIRPKGDTILSAFVHCIVCKSQFHKCELRNFLRILKKYFTRFPALIDAYRLIIIVGLLGNYVHAQQRPGLLERMDVYWTFDQTRMTDSDFFEWIEGNKAIAEYAGKEFYIHSVEATGCLDSIFQSEETWENIKNNTKSAMDTTRALMKRRKILLEAEPLAELTVPRVLAISSQTFKTINHELALFHDEARSCLTKSFKKYFVEMLNKILKRVKEDTIENSLSTIPILSQNFLDPEVIQMIELVVSSIEFSIDGRFQTRWLLLFGVSIDTVRKIRSLYFRFHKKNLNETTFGNTLLEVFRDDFHGFHATSLYVTKLLDKSMIQHFELPDYIRENQINALKFRFKVLPWEKIPFNYEEFYYCPACGNWIHPHIHTNRQNLEAAFALGLEMCIYCWDTKKIYCKRESNSVIIKKMKDDELLLQDTLPEGNTPEEAKANRKLAKSIRLFKTKSVCRKTELKTTEMIGKIVKINNKMWVLCEICAVVTPFDHLTLSSNGLVCPLHVSDVGLTNDVPKRFNQKYEHLFQKILDLKESPTAPGYVYSGEREETEQKKKRDDKVDLESIDFVDPRQRELNHLLENMPASIAGRFEGSLVKTHQKKNQKRHQLEDEARFIMEQEKEDRRYKLYDLISFAVNQDDFCDPSIVHCFYCDVALNSRNKEKCFQRPVVDDRVFKRIYLCEKHYQETDRFFEHAVVPNSKALFAFIGKREFFVETHKKSLKGMF